MAGVTEMSYLHFLLSIFVGRLLRFLILGILIIAYGPEILTFLMSAFQHHRGADLCGRRRHRGAHRSHRAPQPVAHAHGNPSLTRLTRSSSSPLPIRVIGAGLAGPEAAWQCARRGLRVTLCEMRPLRTTPAHETDLFAELVCSNSLKSDSENSAPWLLKQEMRHAGSLLMEMARRSSVPAGHALAVDRARVQPPRHRGHRRRAAHPRRARRGHLARRTSTASPSSPPARSPRTPWPRKFSASAAATASSSSTPSPPSSKPIPSTTPRSTWRRATIKAPPTTSTVP